MFLRWYLQDGRDGFVVTIKNVSDLLSNLKTTRTSFDISTDVSSFPKMFEFFYGLSADVLSVRANAKKRHHSSILTVAKLTIISVDKTKDSFLLPH